MSAAIRISRPAAGVAAILICRPEVKNALSTAVLDEIAGALSDCAADAEVRCAVISGANGDFAAGADLRELAAASAATLHARAALWRKIAAFPKPLLAAVEGCCLGGGCELALCCDIVIAARDARFGQPEVRLGLMPGAGGGQKWLRALGRRRAARYLLSGDAVGGGDAGGLVSEVVDGGEALERALRIADKIAALPPAAVGAIKRALAFGENAPLAAALEYERGAYFDLFQGGGWREPVAAFLAKK